MPKLRWSQYLSILVLCGCFLLIPGVNPLQSFSPQVIARESQPLLPPLIHSISVPIYSSNIPAELSLGTLSADAVYVMDRQSGAILYQKNANQTRYPASTAKMMTALVARQNYKLDDVVTVKEEAFSTGSIVGLHVGERLTVEQLLNALLIPFGNDAAFVLANHHRDGYAGFIKSMNEMAQRIHLRHSEFRNPSGLDSDKQESTARDLAIIANEVMKDPVLRNIVDKKFETVSDISGNIRHPLTNTNELLGVIDGVVGIKTGTTEFAGENLVTEVDRNGHQIIIVLLGSKDRFAEMKHVIDWVYSTYHWQQIER